MLYTIYETTNKINGKKYIGKHVTADPDDDYLGSGLLLTNALKKYGRENFEKKVLYVFDNDEQMNAKEKELINEDIVNNNLYYNIALGGQGGKIALYESNPNYEEICKKISLKAHDRSEQSSMNASNNHKTKKIGMYGKTHTDEAKRKIGNAHKNKNVSRETRKKISEANKGRQPPNKGRKMTDVVGPERAKEMSDTTSRLNRERFTGIGNPMFGKKHSDDTKDIIRQKALKREKKQCIHCHGYFSPSTYSRWHNDNCKKKR